jgi:hypothetical protein
MYFPLVQIKIGKNNYKLFGSIFLLIGLILFLGTLNSFFSIRKKYSQYIQVEGRVVSNRLCENKKYPDASKPKVLFVTKDNRKVEFLGNMCSTPPSFKEDEIVKVLYPENSPNQAILAQGDDIYFSVLMWGFFCFIFLSLGVAIFVFNGDRVVIGMGADIFIGGSVIFMGLFYIFMDLVYWNHVSSLVTLGILTIVVGVLIIVWGIIKEIYNRKHGNK